MGGKPDACYVGSIHVPSPVAGAVKIDWEVARPRADRVRIKQHTCDCRPVFYELCQAGGLMFIRRTTVRGKIRLVDESPWVVTRQALEMWRMLLAGQAH